MYFISMYSYNRKIQKLGSLALEFTVKKGQNKVFNKYTDLNQCYLRAGNGNEKIF